MRSSYAYKPNGISAFTKEVVKTRLQLQGELAANSSGSSKPYGNPLKSFMKILRNEGYFGIQKGLLPAYAYQILLNGTRLGMYDPTRRELQILQDNFTDTAGSYPALPMVTAGALSGITGAAIASPLFLVKTVEFY